MNAKSFLVGEKVRIKEDIISAYDVIAKKGDIVEVQKHFTSSAGQYVYLVIGSDTVSAMSVEFTEIEKL